MVRQAGLWLAAALVFVSGAAEAATYAYRNDTFSYDAPSASATTVGWHSSGNPPACTDYEAGDDDWADISFPSGFAFTFGGGSYSGLRIYSNGILAFGTDVSGFHRDYTAQALPITSAPVAFTGCPRAVPVNLMQVYWIDIVAGTANSTSGASIKYELLGTAPNRRFVISWVNVKLYGQTARYNFQVALYESAAGVNGNFRYQYTSGSSNGSNATVGVQLSTTDYTQYSYDQQFIDTTNGTAILWYPANQLATKSAEYRFDESVWTGTAGEIKDTSGSSRDASRAGAAASTANGRLCRGADIPRNTSANTIDAVATPVTVGQTGSIDFWFRSNSAWNASSSQAMLFDATLSQNRPFFLVKQADGALYFAVSDSTGTKLEALTSTHNYAAGTWHHIGVTWNIRGGTNLSLIQVYIDGTLVATDRGTTNGTLPSLGTLHVGDNRTSGVVPSQGSGNSANGIIDEFYVYAIDISGPQIQTDMNLTRATCTSLDHFHIIHGGSADCGTANVTIEAHDPGHALYSLAGSTMSVSTSTGNGSWSAVTAINPVTNVGSGTATYTFANEASVVLALTNTNIETLNINVTSGSITEHSYVAATCSSSDYTYGTVCDADLTFGSCIGAFECLETGVSYTKQPGPPRNPLYTKLAGTAFSFDVVAVDKNGNRATSYAANGDKSVTVELVDGTTGSCTARTQVATTTLVFAKADHATDQGRKAVSFTVATPYRNLYCRVNDGTMADAACSSDNFAVRPGSVTLATTPTMATPPSASAAPTLGAGDGFVLSATATTGYTGTLTLDATRLTAQTTTQASSVASGGTVGTLTPASLVANQAIAANNAAYSEVGYAYLAVGAFGDATFTAVDRGTGDCVTVTTGDGNFSTTLDASGRYGCDIGSLATSLGRFVPHHFDTAVVQGCAPTFTYSAQPFDLTVTARNAAGGATQNYQGSYARAVTVSDANAVTGGTLAPATIAASQFASGVASLARSDASPPSYTFTRATPDRAPGTIKLRVTDGEASSATAPGVEGTALIRIGRLRLSNVYGYRSPLQMPVEAQYWTGNSWVRNGDDNCTALATANIYRSVAGWTPTGPGALAGGAGVISLVPSAAGSATVCADLGTDPTPGVACVATSAALPWLKGNWPPGTAWDNDPSATATFGVFSPENRRGIYNREMY
jgi:MSHA biogenesis protein MshQ